MERAFKICAEGKGDELTKDQLFNYLCALGNPSQFAPQRTSQLPLGNSLSARTRHDPCVCGSGLHARHAPLSVPLE